MESALFNPNLNDFSLDTWSLLVTLSVISVALILLLDHYIKAAHQQMMIELQLNKLFWKFLSTRQIQQYKIYLRYNLLKLFLASIIISTLTYFITSKKYPLSFCSQFSFIVFGIWNIGSLLFYYILNHSKNFQPLYYTSLLPSENNNNNNNNDYTVNSSKVYKKVKEVDINLNVNNPTTKNNKDVLKKRLPVTVITGFLGAGKTTLVKNILNNTVGLKVLVIENEIGAEGVDHELLLTAIKKEEIILLNNGCICCSVRNDLIETFHTLFASVAFQRLDWVVIETTGIADPAPIIQLFYMDSQCKNKLRIDSVITVIDSKHIFNHLAIRNTSSNNNITTNTTTTTTSYEIDDDTISHQIGYADIIILNKIDLVTSTSLSTIINTLTAINTTAAIYPCSLTSGTNSSCNNIDIEKLLNVRAFDNPNKSWNSYNDIYSTSGSIASSSSSSTASSFSNIKFPIIRNEKGEIIKRKVRNSFTASTSNITTTPHDGITTVTLTTRVPLDINKFNRWMSVLLKLHGEQIFRMKGVLLMNGYDRQFIVQGVHMVFEGSIGSRWNDILSASTSCSPVTANSRIIDIASHLKLLKYSKLVFIGKKLSEMNLESNFHACEANEDFCSQT